MINVFFKNKGHAIKDATPSEFKSLQPTSILWVDLLLPTEEDREAIEKNIKVNLVSKAQAEEIESTSKYRETSESIVINMNFCDPQGEEFVIEPVSFILNNEDILVSLRHSDCEVFKETERRLREGIDANIDGTDLLMTLIEAHIDREADMIEMVARSIAELSKEISTSDNVSKTTIKRISGLQERILALRESIYDMQRTILSMRRSGKFPAHIQPRLQLMLKDVDSLINHADFSFQRLDSLQDTALGLINIEQNEIVKILSVAAVVFMPPTLVASMYGMNFKYMPELDWVYQTDSGMIIPLGYIMAILIMIVFSFLTIWFFKYKKWL